MLKRAWSTIEFKAVDEDKRIIEGIASTPATDRYEDVVDSEGAQYKLPLPFLWQHQHGTPIGWVEEVKTSKAGIRVRVRMAAQGITEEIDKAWSLIKAGLVRGMSIGFVPIEFAHINGTYGYHFTKWDWLELSAVTVPANAEATITSIKSIDQEHLRAVSGTSAGSKVVRLKTSPGVPGQRPKDTIMKKTYLEQIEAFEAKSATSQARLDEIMEKAADEGRTLNDEEKVEFEQLTAEVKEIGEHVARLKPLADRAQKEAKPAEEKPQIDASTQRIPAGQITVRSNLAPGQRFARAALALARCRGNLHEAAAYALAHKGWMDTSPDVAKWLQMKTAIPAADTSTSGWASEWAYANNLQNDFIEYLRPRTIIGRIQGFRPAPFNIRVGGMSAGLTGYWVGESAPIPVSKGTASSMTLGITKAGGIAPITKELLKTSSPSAEIVVRNDLVGALQYVLDRTFLDPTMGAISNERPASVLYGLTGVQPSGTNYAALATDFKSLMANIITDNIEGGGVWVMSRTTALALSLMVTSLGVQQFPDMTPEGGTLFGYPVLVSQSAYFGSGSPDYANIIAFVIPSEIYLADEGMVDVEMSDQVSLQLLDNPTNDSGGSTVATSMVSMYQTESVAIKAVRYINWKVRRSNAAAFIRNANYA